MQIDKCSLAFFVVWETYRLVDDSVILIEHGTGYNRQLLKSRRSFSAHIKGQLMSEKGDFTPENRLFLHLIKQNNTRTFFSQKRHHATSGSSKGGGSNGLI